MYQNFGSIDYKIMETWSTGLLYLEQLVVTTGVVYQARGACHARCKPLDDQLELRVARALRAAAPVAGGHGSHAVPGARSGVALSVAAQTSL